MYSSWLANSMPLTSANCVILFSTLMYNEHPFEPARVIGRGAVKLGEGTIKQLNEK